MDPLLPLQIEGLVPEAEIAGIAVTVTIDVADLLQPVALSVPVT
jgi:hypothetical protein